MTPRLERLDDRLTPYAFNYGAHPIDAFYHFPTPDGRPIPGWDGPVQQALCDVNGDGFTDEVYLPGPGGSGRAVAYTGAPGGSQAVVMNELVLGDAAFRGGVSFAEGFDTNGDGVPDTLVAVPGDGGGAVVAVVGPGGDRQIAVGPDDYRRGVVALDGFRPEGGGSEAVQVILAGGNGPVLVQADIATGAVLASVYLPPGYDTFAPAEQGVYVDGVPVFGVQQGDDPTTTILLDANGTTHHLPPFVVGGPFVG
jgi:hypothetical protein